MSTSWIGQNASNSRCLQQLADLALYRKASNVPYAAPAGVMGMLDDRCLIEQQLLWEQRNNTYRSSKCSAHRTSCSDPVDATVVHGCGHAPGLWHKVPRKAATATG